MKKGRVLLLTPNLKGMDDGVNRIQPSLGVMLIAAMLEQHGHNVKIHDTALEGWENRVLVDKKKKKVMIGQTDDQIKSVISNFRPDVVAISVLFSNFLTSAKNIAKLVKEVNKNIKVILGGNHISNAVIDYNFGVKDPNSNLPDYIEDLETPNIDFAMIGEGEKPITMLVDCIVNKTDNYSNIPGLIKRIGPKKYIINPKSEKHDLNLLPRPARHLVNMEGYFKIGAFQSAKARSNRVLSVMCSRGCPEKCTFCTTPQMWGSNVRWRTTENIKEEVSADVKSFNIGEIQFLDDTLTVNKKNLFSLCDYLEKLGLPWCTPNGTKVNYHLRTQSEMYQRMADSGCYQITLACESGNQRVLDNLINKRLDLETVYPAIERAKKAGMLVHTFWILGYPGETFEEIQNTVNFAMNSGADSFGFAILNPLPGTPIYRQVMKEKLWWNGRTMDDMMLRSSLIKVDGFNGPEEFEKFVNDANVRANLMLKEKDPDRFKYKYGEKAAEDHHHLQRQS